MGRGRGERREKGRERREEGSGMLGSCGREGVGEREGCLGSVVWVWFFFGREGVLGLFLRA